MVLLILFPFFSFAQENSPSPNSFIDYFKNPLKIFSKIKGEQKLDQALKSPQEAREYILNETEFGSQLNPEAIGETIKNEIKEEVDRQIEIQKEKVKNQAWNIVKEIIEKIITGLIDSIKEVFQRS